MEGEKNIGTVEGIGGICMLYFWLAISKNAKADINIEGGVVMHHEFLGLYLDEWASLFAIGGGVGTLLALVMGAILQPIKNSIDKLTNAIHELTSDTHANTRRIDDLEDKFEIHIGEAKVRNQRIKALEKEVFDRGKN